MLSKAMRYRSNIRWKKTISVYILMLPAILYLLVNNYLPMAGIIMAFKKINLSMGLLKSPWCGFENFKFLFTTNTILLITRNTVLYNVAFILLDTVIGVSVAIFLNEVRSKAAQRLYQSLMLISFLMSWVVVSYLVEAFLNVRTGFIVKTIFPALGIGQIYDFYMEPSFWPFILIFVHIWKSIGFTAIIYYSAIVGINEEFYEAAKIDGATKWQEIKTITLPCLKPTIVLLFILSMGKIFYSDFGLFYQVPKNSGMLYNVTQTIDTFVYNALMTQNNLGMSSAAGFYQSLVGFVLVILANWVIRKVDPESALI